MTYRAVDCMGFAGGMTLGVVQSGFELVGKRELKGGFGVPNCEANRYHLGHSWEAEVGDERSWTPVRGVDLVFGNPPCSGFSVMTDKRFRGVDAKINHCMWAFAGYAARCAPPVAVFESVRSAYSVGRDLMVKLRAKLEEDTGLRYDLYHVMHNARHLGGAGERPRYFWVASRVPFGVEWPRVRQPFLRDVWGDLEGMADTWQAQPYRRPATWWSGEARAAGGADGHVTHLSPYVRRALDLLHANGGWPQGDHIGGVARRFYEEHGHLPPSWSHLTEKLVKVDFHMGYTSLVRWRYDAPARVITGGALGLTLHPTEDRPITHREAARVMGFPDDWAILPLRGKSGLAMTWGKGITVQCGRWVGRWVRAALDGAPGSVIGDEIGDRERLITPPRSLHEAGKPDKIRAKVRT